MRAILGVAILVGSLVLFGGCNSESTRDVPWRAGLDADGNAPAADTEIDGDVEASGDSAVDGNSDIGLDTGVDGDADTSADDVWSDRDFTNPAISSGMAHVCMVRRSGEVGCWGSDRKGQLGDGDPYIDTPPPVRVEGISTATGISAGRSHSCASPESEVVQCWGSGEHDQLGMNPETNPSPVELSMPGNVDELAAGRFHTCAAMEGGSVQCWGAPGDQLGKIPKDFMGFPIEVSDLPPARNVAAGATHTCAVLEGGGVRCWGRNSLNQLGDADEDASTTPVPVQVEQISSATEVAAGQEHTCAVLKTGEIRCWGHGVYGELGNGKEGGGETTEEADDYTSATPVDVEDINSAVDIACGDDHSCALLEGGGIRCWGWGGAGQLGNGKKGRGENKLRRYDDYRSTTPVEVEGINSAVEIAAGERDSCAILENDEVRCWGSSIAHGKEPNSAVPVEVNFE